MIRDKEVLELLREEPELLAVADAVGATQRAGRRQGRRAPRRAIALACLGFAVLVLVFTLGRGGGLSVVDRALAAVGEGPVLHAIIRTPDSETTARVEIATGRGVAGPQLETEMWLHERRGILHVLTRREGRVVEDGAFRYAEVARDPTEAFSDPFQIAGFYRKALEDGHMREIGSGTLLGRDVVWLEARGPAGDPSREVVWRAALDRETWQLLALRLLMGGKPAGQLDVVRLEALPEGSHAFPRPGPDDGRGSVVVMGTELGPPVTLAQARDALPVPALWPGESVAGETFHSVTTFTDISDSKPPKRTRGVELGYGKPTRVFPPPLRVFDHPITVSQVPLGADLDTPLPPQGFMDVSKSEESETTGDGKTVDSTIWNGRLELRGLSITIQGPSRASVLEVAQALRPIP